MRSRIFLCIALLGTVPVVRAAEIYGQAGYQRTGSNNAGFGGGGVAFAGSDRAQIFGEFNFVSLQRGSRSTGPGGTTIRGSAGLWDLSGGVRGFVQRRDRHETYLLAGLGIHRYAASGRIQIGGTTFTTSDATLGGVVSLGGGWSFGSDRVRIGPEVRYLRYFQGADANAVRVGIVLRFGR